MLNLFFQKTKSEIKHKSLIGKFELRPVGTTKAERERRATAIFSFCFSLSKFELLSVGTTRCETETVRRAIGMPLDQINFPGFFVAGVMMYLRVYLRNVDKIICQVLYLPFFANSSLMHIANVCDANYFVLVQ